MIYKLSDWLSAVDSSARQGTAKQVVVTYKSTNNLSRWHDRLAGIAFPLPRAYIQLYPDFPSRLAVN